VRIGYVYEFQEFLTIVKKHQQECEHTITLLALAVFSPYQTFISNNIRQHHGARQTTREIQRAC
jgi:hypothetical protein